MRACRSAVAYCETAGSQLCCGASHVAAHSQGQHVLAAASGQAGFRIAILLSMAARNALYQPPVLPHLVRITTATQQHPL